MEKLATGYTLIEGPVWDPELGLLFSDVHDGGVYCLGSRGDVTPVLAHRRGIGGMALHALGGLVVGGRNVAYKGPAASGTLVLLDQEGAGGVGFNDLTTDTAGRVYVGSLGSSPFDRGSESKTGCLHMIDLDGSTRTLSDGVRLTNGLGFSPDGSRLYHSDSREQLVRSYPVRGDGSVGPWEVLARIDRGAPDGLTVAIDGSVWVAIAGDGCVRVFEPDGSERPRVEVPQPMVTSVCFGGDELRELYIVTGSVGCDSDHAGSVYRTSAGVAGLPIALARVPLR